MICPRCSVAEVSPLTGRCVLCGYVPSGTVSVQQAVADEVLETVQRELAGRFQLQVLLRRDRRSNLYVARDLENDRLVALRLIPRPGPVDNEFLQRFEQAAAVAAQLRHPHVIPVVGHGVTTSLLWYAMEPIKGRTVTAVLERGPRGRAAVQELLEQVASGLEFLHRNGLVHGGISPTTVMMDGDGWARITDPGIIAAVFRAAPPGSEWEDLLDPAFAAPEVLDHRLVGPAADQYSLALLAYQSLAGKPAWNGTTIDDVRRERAAGVEPLDSVRTDVPPYVASAVARALRDAPADRFGSVLDFVAVMSGATARATGAAGLSPSAAPGGPPVLVIPDNERTPVRGRRRLVVAVLAVVAMIGTWIGLSLVRRPSDEWVVSTPSGLERPRAPAVPARSIDSVPAALPAPADSAALRRPARVQPPSAVLPAPTATLFVNSSPWGTVYVDGKAMGNTPRPNLQIVAGVHQLRIVRDGYVPVEREIRLTPGQVLRITDIVLEPIRP